MKSSGNIRKVSSAVATELALNPRLPIGESHTASHCNTRDASVQSCLGTHSVAVSTDGSPSALGFFSWTASRRTRHCQALWTELLAVGALGHDSSLRLVASLREDTTAARACSPATVALAAPTLFCRRERRRSKQRLRILTSSQVTCQEDT